MISRNRSSIGMGTPSFLDLKKQASFFFKEKLKTARLALTDVTPLQLLVFFPLFCFSCNRLTSWAHEIDGFITNLCVSDYHLNK